MTKAAPTQDPGNVALFGTLAAYWEAHMALLSGSPSLPLDDRTWPIYTYRPVAAVARVCGEHADQCCVRDVILSPGCLSVDAHLTRSVLSPGVKVHGAVVDESVNTAPHLREGSTKLASSAYPVLAGKRITLPRLRQNRRLKKLHKLNMKRRFMSPRLF